MQIVTLQIFALLGLLINLTSAIPLLWNFKNLSNKRAPQSYSVIAVDGGSSTQPATKTVTDAITQVQTATVIITPTDAAVQAQTVTLATTVIVEPSVTSLPYDDGQWHTTYYFRSTITPTDFNAAAAITSAPAQASASPSPATSIDLGQWSYWNQRDHDHQDSQ